MSVTERVEWAQNLEKEIDAIPDCTALYLLMDKLIAYLMKLMQDNVNNMLGLVPMMKIPTNLQEVIDWITASSSKALKAYNACMVELAELTAIYASLMAHIAAKAAAMGCLIPPTPPTPPLPPTP